MIFQLLRQSNAIKLLQYLPQCTRSIANRRLLPRIELPDKPVRPLTPYLRYIKENAVNTIVSDQVVQQSNRFKLVKLANIWSTMDDAAKAKYQKGYADEYAKYTKKLAQYKENLTFQQEIELLRIKDEKIHKKRQVKIKKEKIELGMPRKPPSSFLLFLIDQKKEVKNESRDWFKAKWASLSDEAKKPYMELGRKQIATYQKALLRWEEPFIEAGKPHMVRQKTLNAKLREQTQSKHKKNNEKIRVAKPKMPISPFNLFVNQQKRLSINESIDWYKAKWVSLSDDVKQPFIDSSNEMERRYQENLQWIEKSGEAGKQNSVQLKETDSQLPPKNGQPKDTN